MEKYSFRDLLRGPALLSLVRLPLAVLFVLTLDRPVWPWLVLVASAVSDVLDGWYARRTGQVTKTGAVVDGIMDKVFVGAVVIGLIASQHLSILAALALATRDVGEVLIAAWVAAARRARLTAEHHAQPLGKLTTLLQYLTIGNAIVRTPMTPTLAVLTAVAGVLAAIAYFREEATPLVHGGARP